MQSLIGLCHERIEYEQQVLEESVEDQLTDLMGELHAIAHADCFEQSLVSKSILSLAEQISLSYLGFPEGVEEQVCAPYPLQSVGCCVQEVLLTKMFLCSLSWLFR